MMGGGCCEFKKNNVAVTKEARVDSKWCQAVYTNIT